MTDRQLLELLLEKVTNIEQKVANIETEQQAMKADISELKDGQLRLESRMETEVIDKVRALFDAREVQHDINQRIISTLERIEAKIDVLQMETAHIRRIK
ncbi:MAG: hypothetical protein GXW85_00800 [Clostridia bacterium]|nr:hypothetical protein [Clostridia bacterium]